MTRDYQAAALQALRDLNDPDLLESLEGLDPDMKEWAARALWAATATMEDLCGDFCERSEPELVAAITALAVPRWFDQELGERILVEHLGFDGGKAHALMAEVSYIFFVHEIERRGWQLERRAREFFIQRAQENPEDLLALYRTLADYYAGKLKAEEDPTDYDARNLTLKLAGCELHFDHKTALDRLAVLAGRAIFAQKVGVPGDIARLLRENERLLASKVGPRRAKWIIAHYETLSRWARERVIS